MIILYVLLPSILVFELLRQLVLRRLLLGKLLVNQPSVQRLTPLIKQWQFGDSLRFSLVVLFIVLGLSHFSVLKHDMLAMLPPGVPKSMWVIYLTGVFEIAGGVGLLIGRTRLAASYCLMLLLVCVSPANIYAALNDIPFNGRAATPLLIRVPLQLLVLSLLLTTVLLQRKKPLA